MTKQILVFSDVHLRHKKTPVKYIIENIKRYIHSVIYGESIDCVFIAGDLFDSLINLNSIELTSIISWINTFLTLCAERNTSVRILEGTPSHDWKQSKLFQSIINIKDSLKEKLDFLYHDDLTIEYVKKLGMNVLYIPDEYGLTSDYTFQQVQNKLKEYGLSKVDLVIMHGLFDFQEINTGSKSISKTIHKSENYLDITNHYIFVGHSHMHIFFKRILVEGSFDRLAHGEEEPKGFILAKLETNPTDDSFYFIENKTAKTYKTIEIKTSDIGKFKKQIEKEISKLSKESYIRLLIKNTNPIYTLIDSIVKDYSEFNFTKKVLEDKKAKPKINIEKISHDGITINQNTLRGIVKDKISMMTISDAIKEKAIDILDSITK